MVATAPSELTGSPSCRQTCLYALASLLLFIGFVAAVIACQRDGSPCKTAGSTHANVSMAFAFFAFLGAGRRPLAGTRLPRALRSAAFGAVLGSCRARSLTPWAPSLRMGSVMAHTVPRVRRAQGDLKAARWRRHGRLAMLAALLSLILQCVT